VRARTGIQTILAAAKFRELAWTCGAGILVLILAQLSVVLVKSESAFLFGVGMILGIPLWTFIYLPLVLWQALIFLFSGYWGAIPSLPPAFDSLVAHKSHWPSFWTGLWLVGLASVMWGSFTLLIRRRFGRSLGWFGLGFAYGSGTTAVYVATQVYMFRSTSPQVFDAVRRGISILHYPQMRFMYAIGVWPPSSMPGVASHYDWAHYVEQCALLSTLTAIECLVAIGVIRWVIRMFKPTAEARTLTTICS
jgi:hypothetical protein